ncbi:MAG: DNA integrity scanning protein DisA nucleotide-binding domain protein [Clostridia bacterium]|nr:DNA integrity scanning protein DisA nucleotide-binding domain protein [Clostridia bacterium]
MILLATFLEGVEDVIAKLGNFFTNFQLLYAFEWLIFFLMIYYVSKVLRENDATKLMLVYWAALLCGGVMLCCAPDLFSKPFFLAYILMLSAIMLIFFNVEVKKMLWDVHRTKSNSAEKSGGRSSEVHSPEDVEHCISDIIKAVQNMSKSKTGALIVLSKGSLPKTVLQSGQVLEANISTQLIESVFFPNSPLHDGALIIRGHKIQAAGCFLPLTQKTSYPKEFGTRHRAGIGITEVANVVALVVSEETGIISIVKQGNVERFPDTELLTKALRDYYWQELPLTEKKSRVVISK